MNNFLSLLRKNVAKQLGVPINSIIVNIVMAQIMEYNEHMSYLMRGWNEGE